MRHHVSGLLDVVNGHFKIPFLVKRRALDPPDKNVWPYARYVVDELRLQKEILTRKKKIADVVLRGTNRNSVTNAKRTQYVEYLWISSVLLEQRYYHLDMLVLKIVSNFVIY